MSYLNLKIVGDKIQPEGDNVKANVSQVLNWLENKYDISILYAVESGSRAWGFHSKDSDYDIRFIYIHNSPEWYLNITKQKETIEGFSMKRDYDWAGWDIRKSIQHLKESNPSILEWLSSPIVYRDIRGFSSEMRHVANRMHNNISLCHHYKNMAIRNWEDRIEGKEIVNTKKYMYIVRPIGMLHWLMKFPDRALIIDYFQILEDLKDDIPNDTYQKIQELLKLKQSSSELGENPRIKEIDTYVQNILERFQEHNNQKPEEVNYQNVISLHRKLEHQYKKIMSVCLSQSRVNRSEYLIGICFGLQFTWLQQHPNLNKRHIPEKISQLLSQVEINSDIRQLIRQVVDKDDVCHVEKISEVNRQIPSCYWQTFLGRLLTDYYFNLVDEPVSKDKNITDFLSTNYMSMDGLPREDLIEFWLKKQMPELIWLLENPEHNMSRIPKQVHTQIKSTSPEFQSKVNNLISEGRSNTYLFLPELNSWMESIVRNNKSFIEEITEKNNRMKEENTHKRYQHSIKKINAEVFNKLFIDQINLTFYN